MKNKLVIVILFVSIFILSACSGEYIGWKNIEIEEVGNFKIPNAWNYKIEGNIIYFTQTTDATENKDDNFVVGAITDGGKGIDSISKYYGEEIKYANLLESQVFSNNAYVGKSSIFLSGNLCEVITFWLNSVDRSAYFIVFDKDIDYELIKKIAKSFVMRD